ncbi:MAG: glucosamine-6-phosphate deaminase [Candidatus Dadabacteria bacterium]|nr:MAG: glucosamine-6-phosphate deaminase [Candidatus Dadabacteria bacterium]
MEVIIEDTMEKASRMAARYIAKEIRKKPDAALGLSTGRSPRFLYRELGRMHKEEDLDFSRVKVFNVDEYVGIEPEHPASSYFYFNEYLFSSVNISASNIRFLDSTNKDIVKACSDYEKAIAEAGGIDIQVLGVGSVGHIAYNEPTSSFGSRTRIKTLTEVTRRDIAPLFKDRDEVPKYAVTMGIGTIMDARSVVMLAFGKEKADIVAKMVEGAVTSMVPASVLQFHRSVKVFLDEDAASRLTLVPYYKAAFESKPESERF